MGRYDKAIVNTLCKLESSSTSTGESLEEIRDLLQQILDEPDIESLVPKAICDGTTVTGYIAYVLDENTNAVIEVYFDNTGASTTTRPVGEPCGDPIDYEFKFFQTEKCLNDSKVLEVLCILYENGAEVSTETFWIVDGVKVTTDPGVTDCVIPCEPLIESFLGSNATLAEYNSFEIFIPKCCEVTVTTSAGTFILPAQSLPWVYSKQFECILTEYTIAGDCIDTVTTVLSKTK